MPEGQAPSQQRESDLDVVALDVVMELARPRRRHADSTAAGPATKDRDASAECLELCPDCGGDLVYPTDWAPIGTHRWKVSLRCPECEWYGSGVHEQDIVDRFDEVLDDGTQALLDDLEMLTRANMQEQVDLFVTALRDDLIVPEDF